MKKGQMNIQQMAFMLLAVALFFILVGLFFLSTGLSRIEQSKAQLEEDNAALVVTNLAKSPEFACGGAFGTTKLNCVDFDKAFILSKRDIYSSFWDVKGIEIRKIYPSSTEKCTSQNFPNCGLLVIQESESKGNDKSTFISLCYKQPSESIIYSKCEIAKLVVRY